MIVTHWPQPWGRCARMFGTWRSRLPQELRLRGIRILEEVTWVPVEGLKGGQSVLHDEASRSGNGVYSGQRHRSGQDPLASGDSGRGCGQHGAVPEAVQTVDRFHAKERLHTLSNAFIRRSPVGPGMGARTLSGTRCRSDRDPAFGPRHRGLPPRGGESGPDLISKRNRHRMRYVQFEAQELCTSTGVVEAGFKNAIGARLKRSGMHWSVRRANSIRALRCIRLSGRLEDFWDWRTDSKAAP